MTTTNDADDRRGPDDRRETDVTFNLQRYLENMSARARQDTDRILETFQRHEAADVTHFARIDSRFSAQAGKLAKLEGGQKRLEEGHKTLVWFARVIVVTLIGGLVKFFFFSAGVH